MERHDAARLRATSPLLCPFAPRPFRVKRFEDNNPKAFMSLPVCLPPHWPRGLNYSARSAAGVVLETLPSDSEGTMCALLIMDNSNPLARPGVPPAELLELLDREFLQFTGLVGDTEVAAAAGRAASSLQLQVRGAPAGRGGEGAGARQRDAHGEALLRAGRQHGDGGRCVPRADP
mmetsp:Transcript_17582/g.35019  ORF Transcript_17582/g.35019 Transcript_17582/m.35019 type:complete len:176 (+) Transcript_17582:601-1128(+)